MELSPNTETAIQDIQKQLRHLQTLICEKVTFSTVEMAFKTGLDERTICNYCRIGAIRAAQPVKGGSYLIPVSELDNILKQAELNRRKSEKVSTKALNKIKQ